MTGNNYGELNRLRDIQDEIMEAIAVLNGILGRSLPLDESRLLARSIGEKRQTYLSRLKELVGATSRCLIILEALIERGDLLEAELFAGLDKDLEDADEAKESCVKANRRLGSWRKRNGEALKNALTGRAKA